MTDSRRGDRNRPGRRWRRPEWFDPLWLFFPNTLALLAVGIVLSCVLVVLLLVLGFAGLLR